ncbi:MAG: hypothetical protein HYU64_09355 [Armatimonadetes bacterium]|nr:hypothetical protein [Armatimonadota bacterium]
MAQGCGIPQIGALGAFGGGALPQTSLQGNALGLNGLPGMTGLSPFGGDGAALSPLTALLGQGLPGLGQNAPGQNPLAVLAQDPNNPVGQIMQQIMQAIQQGDIQKALQLIMQLLALLGQDKQQQEAAKEEAAAPADAAPAEAAAPQAQEAAQVENNNVEEADQVNGFPKIVGATPEEAARIRQTLSQLPAEDRAAVKEIRVGDLPGNLAGLAQPVGAGGVVSLDRANWSRMGSYVLIHEVGHAVDYKNGYTARGGQWGQGPFISGYARTNPKEDFAESYARYYTNPGSLQTSAPGKYQQIHSQQSQKR